MVKQQQQTTFLPLSQSRLSGTMYAVTRTRIYALCLVLWVSILSIAAQAPTITSFTPASGAVGTLVTITGTNLTPTTALTIGGVSAISVSNDGTTLVAMVMPNATTGDISVTTAGGTAISATNFTVTPTLYPSQQQGSKLVGTGGDGTESQGTVAVSADGNTAVIGGYYYQSGQGAAWAFTRTNGVWAQQGTMLLGSNASQPASFGYSVGISADGNTVIIGGNSDNMGQGAAWIFTRTNGVWTQQGNKLVGTGGVGFPEQGYSVSLSADGNTALIGGYADNNNQGATWVFTRTNGVWAQQGNKLVGTGAVGDANQGSAISLSADGNTALIGGYADNNNQGAAWVFTRTNGVWTQQGSKLVGTGAVGVAQQGWAASLSSDGNTAAVGGTWDNSYLGATWIFTRSGGVWAQQGNKLVGTGISGFYSSQGYSVSLSADGNTVIVGAPDDNNGIGAILRFTRSAGVWAQQGNKLVGTGNTSMSQQGYSVSISADGSTTLVGGNADNGFSGATWVFIPSFATYLASTPPFCQNASFDVNYTSAEITFNTGNVFSVQLSDANGSFTSPTIVGMLTSTNTNGTITANLPINQVAGTGYRVRVIASNPSTIGSDNGSNFEIKGSTATASITRNGGILANPTATGETNQLITGCQGTNIVLTAVTGNSGSHKWFKNGVQVGNTSDATHTVNSGWGDYVLIAYDASNCGQATDTIGISLKPTPVANAGTDRNICQGTTTTIGTTAQANTTYTWTPSTHLSSASSANPTVLATLPTTTTYSLQITKSYTILDANFTCSSANDEVLVTLKSQPAAPSISANTPQTCQGLNINVTANNVVGTLKWYADNALISGSNPLAVSNTGGVTKAYTAKNLDANGCYSVASNTLNLIVQPASSPTITSSVGTDVNGTIKVCPGITNAILTANATSGTPVFTWFNPPNANVISTGNTLALSNVSTTSKSYYVKATYTYPNLSCVKQSVTKAIKQDATATGCRLMNDGTESAESAMVVYPNPTSNLLNVKVQVAQAGEATLNLVNSLGQTVWSEKRTFNEGMTELQLSLEHLPTGFYHLTLENGDTIQTVKVVKE